MKKILLLILILMLVALVIWPIRLSIFAQHSVEPSLQPLVTSGSWNAHNYDLVYTIAYSSKVQPNGPLVVYRASATNLYSSVPVIAIQRTDLPPTPLFFPSPDGRYLALLAPSHSNSGTNLSGAALSVLSTDGHASDTLNLVPASAGIGDQVLWSADSHFLYYQKAIQTGIVTNTSKGQKGLPIPQKGHSQGALPIVHTSPAPTGYEEIHRVDLEGHDVTLLHFSQNGSSLRLIGLDRSGALILTLARQHEPVQLLRLEVGDNSDSGVAHPILQNPLSVVATLPSDILPGNVLRVGSDGTSVECERVLNWQPLRYTLIRIGFDTSSGQGQANPSLPPSPLRTIGPVMPLFDTHRFGNSVIPLSRSADGHVLAMSQVTSVRQDLAAQGISGVPAQEALLLADTQTGGTQRLELPMGGQIVQVFWAMHLPMGTLQAVPQDELNALLAIHGRAGRATTRNASVFQQDELMLEGHAGTLFDAPALPKMCYGNCPQGFTGAPHVSAAILHGVAYVESNWHQFNTSDYSVNGESLGAPVESWDGGWGEYQQTWGMPPQCKAADNCRTDAYKVEHDQSYNIGVGVGSLINAWNGSAGVVSSNDPNDPLKANDWFFAVWAYNGASGNNPNDVSSSQYGQWYPGAPFRSVYEEYVWYFAAHPQFFSNGWTDNYVPSLGTSLLPPQSDFIGTSDSFVDCVTCTIPDWTSGSYDRDWVGVGAPDAAMTKEFRTAFTSFGGENVLGLPRDNTGGAAVHRWGNGWVQDFGGGSDHPGTLMLADGSTTPYWVYGGVWTQYLTIDHGVVSCHGYPTSMLSPFANSGLGSDSYLRQNFQTGYIVWDATTNMLAADVCG